MFETPWHLDQRPDGVQAYIRMATADKLHGPFRFDVMPSVGHVLLVKMADGTTRPFTVASIEHRPDPALDRHYEAVVVLGKSGSTPSAGGEQS